MPTRQRVGVAPQGPSSANLKDPERESERNKLLNTERTWESLGKASLRKKKPGGDGEREREREREREIERSP